MLLATLLRQVYVQYRSGSVGGLSKWLFNGQMTASVGFAVYSWLLKVAILAVRSRHSVLLRISADRPGGEYAAWPAARPDPSSATA